MSLSREYDCRHMDLVIAVYESNLVPSASFRKMKEGKNFLKLLGGRRWCMLVYLASRKQRTKIGTSYNN